MFYSFRCVHGRPQFLRLRVAEEVVCAQQFNALLLWQRKRFAAPANVDPDPRHGDTPTGSLQSSELRRFTARSCSLRQAAEGGLPHPGLRCGAGVEPPQGPAEDVLL